MKEGKIERYLKKKIESKGGLALKLTTPGFTGIPDRLLLLPGGEICFAETKSSTGKLSPRQEYVKKQLEQLGFKVYVINSKEQVNEIFS